MQTSLIPAFELAELTSEERARWSQCLDLLASRGSIPAGWLGSRWARRFVAAGFLRYYRGEYHLTETGEAAEI